MSRKILLQNDGNLKILFYIHTTREIEEKKILYFFCFGKNEYDSLIIVDNDLNTLCFILLGILNMF